MTDVSRFMLGRQHAIHPVGYSLIDEFVDALPEAPATFDHTNGFNEFRMLGNGPDPTLTVNDGNPAGDCAFVGLANTVIIDEIETNQPLTFPTSDVVVSTELAFDHGQDLGANLNQLLAYQYKVGVPWLKGAQYAAANFRDPDHFWAQVNAFGSGYIGIVVTQTMMNQTQAGEPWDLTGSPSDDQVLGGHCVVVASRTSAAGDGELITWALRQKFTPRWFKRNVEEAHVLITPEQATAKGNGYGLDIAKLDAALKALGGV